MPVVYVEREREGATACHTRRNKVEFTFRLLFAGLNYPYDTSVSSAQRIMKCIDVKDIDEIFMDIKTYVRIDLKKIQIYSKLLEKLMSDCIWILALYE